MSWNCVGGEVGQAERLSEKALCGRAGSLVHLQVWYYRGRRKQKTITGVVQADCLWGEMSGSRAVGRARIGVLPVPCPVEKGGKTFSTFCSRPYLKNIVLIATSPPVKLWGHVFYGKISDLPSARNNRTFIMPVIKRTGNKKLQPTQPLPFFCDFHCQYADFPPADAVGACRREQAVYCTLLKKFNNRNNKCIARM